MRIGIIGLGLMGGSLGLALKNVSFVTQVFGLDHNAFHEKEAVELGLIDKIVTHDQIQTCDIIFLTIPVEGIIATLHSFTKVPSQTTIIDFGSTKDKIVNNIPKNLRENFVAAHPMAGTEKFGPSAAFASLYTNKVVALCDLEASGKHQRELAIKVFEELNMRIITMNAKDHDLHAAYISHLPHVISYALANSVLAHEDTKTILNLAATGFKDMSRLAKSSPNMWGDIFKQNRDNVIETITIFEQELASLKKQLQNNEWDTLHEKMSHANSLHDIL